MGPNRGIRGLGWGAGGNEMSRLLLQLCNDFSVRVFEPIPLHRAYGAAEGCSNPQLCATSVSERTRAS